MYPYRRSNQRKRNRNNTARRSKGGGGRRLPGSARELLPMLQPATKALAQMLAGNAKASGQFVHARNVVDRADQLVAEKQLERMSSRDREEFLEQLARLKLTVSDAEEEFGPLDAADEDDDAEGEEEAVDDETVDEVDDDTRRAQEEEERRRAEAEAAEERERLRRVALALMAPSSEAPAPKRGAPQHEDYRPAEETAAPAARPRREPGGRAGGRGGATTRRPRITLRAQERETEGESEHGDEGVVSDG